MLLCSGCFDGLHAGHVRYLLEAARLKHPHEALIVALASDDYIRQHKHRAPRWSYAERDATLRALRMVDGVTPHDVEGAACAIRSERPRVFIKGTDWYGKIPQDIFAACDEVGALLSYVHTPGKHTSEAFA